MDCCEFRENYSDYTDGLLDPIRKADARAHLKACELCRRFDAAFRTGIATLRALPPVDVSHGFGSRLRSRLRRELAIRGPAVAHWSGAFGTVLLIAAMGFAGWDLVGAVRGRPGLGVAHAAVAVRRSPPVSWRAAAVARVRRVGDTLPTALDAFHPLQSLLMETDPVVPVAGLTHQRYDVSVVWGGGGP
jgi:anti-sigma factor RsiW